VYVCERDPHAPICMCERETLMYVRETLLRMCARESLMRVFCMCVRENRVYVCERPLPMCARDFCVCEGETRMHA